MADTAWIGNANDKLYLQSGEFTSTIKTSQSISGTSTQPRGISWDDQDTAWCANESTDKLFLQSGQFTSTLKTSENITSVNNRPTAISSDTINTPWSGARNLNETLYLQSGKFSSTVKTSLSVISLNVFPDGISFDGTNTPWSGRDTIKLYLTSGQFTSTLKTSQGVIGLAALGVSWNGTDTPWLGVLFDVIVLSKLILQSGQFTSTVKTSLTISSIDSDPVGIEHGDFSARLGIAADDNSSTSSTSTSSTSTSTSSTSSMSTRTSTSSTSTSSGSSSSTSSSSGELFILEIFLIKNISNQPVQIFVFPRSEFLPEGYTKLNQNQIIEVEQDKVNIGQIEFLSKKKILQTMTLLRQVSVEAGTFSIYSSGYLNITNLTDKLVTLKKIGLGNIYVWPDEPVRVSSYDVNMNQVIELERSGKISVRVR